MSEDRFLRMKEVVSITGLSRSTIYRAMKNNQFPQQMKLSLRAVGWKLSVVKKWMDDKGLKP